MKVSSAVTYNVQKFDLCYIPASIFLIIEVYENHSFKNIDMWKDLDWNSTSSFNFTSTTKPIL